MIFQCKNNIHVSCFLIHSTVTSTIWFFKLHHVSQRCLLYHTLTFLTFPESLFFWHSQFMSFLNNNRHLTDTQKKKSDSFIFTMRKECWDLTTFELNNNKHSLSSLPSLVLIAVKYCTTSHGFSSLLQVHHLLPAV